MLLMCNVQHYIRREIYCLYNKLNLFEDINIKKDFYYF